MSAALLVIAPAMCFVLLAITPTGRPSMRANAVTSSGAKRLRSTVTEPVSASRSMSGVTAEARRSRSGRRLPSDR